MTAMMDCSDHSSSSLLFSPLPSHQSTPPQSSTPSQAHTPTPLTISAHTIEGNSKDFTEYTNLSATPTLSTKPHPQSTSIHTGSSLSKENGLTPPISAPVRVRVSAKKLREIQSPYNSSSSSSLGRGSPLLDSFKMDQSLTKHPQPSLRDDQNRAESVNQSHLSVTEGPNCQRSTQEVPRALTPAVGRKTQARAKGDTGKIKAGRGMATLKQGVLQTRSEPPAVEDTSSESLLVHTEISPTDIASAAQSSRDQLLHRKSCPTVTSKAKTLFRVHPVVTSEPPGHVSTVGQDPAYQKNIRVSQSSAVPAAWDGQIHEGTAKIVATCTAAATAALLATGQARETSPHSLPHPAVLSRGTKKVKGGIADEGPNRESVDGVDNTCGAKTRASEPQILFDRQQAQKGSHPTSKSGLGRRNMTFDRVQLSKKADPPGNCFHDEEMCTPDVFENWYPPGDRRGPQPHPGYSDLIARVSRMEELQHSQLMRIVKDPEKSDLAKMSEGGRTQKVIVTSRVRDECCQTSPVSGLLTRGAHNSGGAFSQEESVHFRSSSKGTDKEAKELFPHPQVNDPTVGPQTQYSGTRRILKENNMLSPPSAHLSAEVSHPDTRPQQFKSIAARPTRLEDSEAQRDGLLNVAKMLSDVQQARADMELECALEEVQAQYTDFGELLQSANNSKEFTDVAWKVAKLLERTCQDGVTGKEGGRSEVAVAEPPGGKPALKSFQRKGNVKTGKASKASDQETRQKPISSFTKVRAASQPARGKVSSSAARTRPLSHSTKHKPSRHPQPVYTSLTAPPVNTHTTLTAPPGNTHTTLTAPPVNTHTTLTAPPGNTHTTLTAPPVNTHTTLTAPPVNTHTNLTAPPGNTHTILTVSSHQPVIPIGPPCLMPSPIYAFHEPAVTPEPAMSTKPSSKSDKFTSTHSSPPGTKEKTAVPTVDACLQTSFSQDSESIGSSLAEGLGERGSSLMERESVEEEVSHENDSFTEPASEGSEPVVAISGSHRSPPPTPHPPPPPSHHTHGGQLSLDELGDKLQGRLDSRAEEWVRQEIMMRMLSQVKPSLSDSVSDSQSFNRSNSCSTCSLDSVLAAENGVQLSAGPTQPVSKETLLSVLKEAVKKELLGIAQEMVKTTKAEQRVMEDDEDRYSYTPPESHTLSTSSISDIEPRPLSTPCPTSPSSHTLSPDHTLVCEGLEPLGTPSLTPPLPDDPTPQTLSSLTLLDTPQVSVEEANVTESLHEMTAVSDHTYPDVGTPIATPTPIPLSIPSPPLPTEPTTVTPLTPHTRHTKELSSSDTSTISTSSRGHSLTSTSSSTDRAVSMGECIQRRPGLPCTNSSLSEGEVPLSPGDVRWGSLFAKTMSVDPAVEAFLELKVSGDSLSDSQDSNLPHHSDFSVGEVGKAKAPLADPFEKFLHKMNASTPDDSTTREHSSNENTLSELPSIHLDHPRHLVSTPPPKKQKRSGHGYRRTNVSPGEVIHLRAKKKSKGSFENDSSVSYPHSEGELPRRITLLNKNKRSAAEDINTGNETRDGIDVINVSRLSSRHGKLGACSPEPEDTLISVSQISVRSSPDMARMPEVIHVQPVTGAHSQIEPESAVTPLRNREPLKVSSFGSMDDLPITINLSELELTDTLTKQSSDLQREDGNGFSPPLQQATSPPPLPSLQRASINVTIPVASQEIIEELKSGESYSSDFDFSSSVSIPLVD